MSWGIDPKTGYTSIQQDGVDAITYNSTGILTGYAPASIAPSNLTQPLTLGTSVATTSGTSIDFTGIPSWVKRITVMLNGVSTNGVEAVGIKLGTSGGIVSTGYVGATYASGGTSAPFSVAFTTPFGATANVQYGNFVLTLVSSNVWSWLLAYILLAF